MAAMAENPATRGIPVVVMTSLLENTVRERSKDFKAILKKPFRQADLFRVLDEILPREDV